jgi:hypothetical protein
VNRTAPSSSDSIENEQQNGNNAEQNIPKNIPATDVAKF